MLVVSHDFLEKLYDAKIIGCAYGFRPWPALDGMVHSVDFICKDSDALRAAFDEFKRWGSESDGDVVAIDIMFREDGTYALSIGPEISRALFRLMPAALHPPLAIGMSYIKIMDTTSAAVRDLASYAKTSFAPISFGGLFLPDHVPITPGSAQVIEGIVPLLKFEMRIFESGETPDDTPLNAYRSRNPGDGGGIGGPSAPPKQLPKDVRQARRKMLETAFPVTMQRVKRAEILSSLKSERGYENLTDDQIYQACANLLVSAELCSGSVHYTEISDEDLPKAVWTHLEGRYEHADGSDLITRMPMADIATQINLDARAILNSFGIATTNLPFSKVQGLMIKKGFVK